MKDKLLEIVNNSIIYKGDSIQDAADYILDKTKSFSYVWGVMIATPNTTYGYYRCSIYENWAALRGYGEFKWNYFIWAG
jgi:predicted secreted acid phosphatase